MTIPPLVTCSWRAIHEAHLAGERSFVPVRTSVGCPKFWPAAEHFPRVREVAPYGLMKLGGEEFRARYVARLESFGIERIVARFDAIHEEYQRTLALICFEPAGQPCHRRLLATWLENQAGQHVPELEPDRPHLQLELEEQR